MGAIKDSRNIGWGWNWVWLGLLGVFVGVFLIGMPKYWDDYMFMYHLRPWFEAQGVSVPENGGNIIKYGIPFKEIWTTWYNEYYVDNSRIGNLLVVIFLMFPKWVGSGLMFVGFIWFVYAGFRLTGVDIRRSATVPLAVFLLGLVLPWRNHMGGMDYQFNYIGVSALAFILLWLLQSGKVKNKRLVLVFVIGFVTGGWQEAISLPLFLGLTAMAVVYMDFRRKDIFVCLSGLLLGIFWILISPGHIARFSRNTDVMMLKVSVLHIELFFIATYIYWIMLAVWLVTITRSRLGIRLFFKDRKMFFITVSGMVSTGIVLMTDTQARVGWWSVLAGIYGLIYVLDKYYDHYWEQYNRRNIILSAFLLIVTYVHWGVVDYTVFKIREAYLEGLEKYVKNPDKVLFNKVINRNNKSILCGNMPDEGIFTFLNLTTYYYFQYPGGRPLLFVPEGLRYVTDTSGERVEGDAGIRKYNGSYYVARGDNPIIKEVYVDYGNHSRKLKVWTGEFCSERNGKDYVYIYLFENWFDDYFSDVKRIDIQEGGKY